MINLSKLPCISVESLLNKGWLELPRMPGYYIAICPKGKMLYVGVSRNLRQRWTISPKSRHHKFNELLELKATLFWLETEFASFKGEKRLIKELKPILNKT